MPKRIVTAILQDLTPGHCTLNLLLSFRVLSLLIYSMGRAMQCVDPRVLVRVNWGRVLNKCGKFSNDVTIDKPQA